MSNITMHVRQGPTQSWVTNFIKAGWKVRDLSNAQWMQMTQANTRIRNSDNTAWLIPQ